MAEDGLASSWTVADREDEAERLTASLHEKALQLDAQGYRVRTKIAHGRSAEEILRFALEEQADLIVLPAHGRGGSQRSGPGSVATRIAQGASTPVLLLRNLQHTSQYQQHVNWVEELTAEVQL
jgi:nucleotide-binding universal stress UspA family protein